MTVNFLFDIDQKVEVTGTGEAGIVTNLMVDDGVKKYFVQGTGDGKWWPERLLVSYSD